jgi:putative nuclease YbcO-like protein
MKRKAPLKPSKILPRRELTRSEPMKKSRKASTPTRQAARDKPCLLNVAGVCNYDTATTVLAHFRWLGDCGMGLKPTDFQGCPACDACNTWTDSPSPRQTRDRLQYESDRNFYAARALVRLRKLESE